ncbi:MAG: DegT/DnrJ/EryC1/StrS family aminotransferase [Candidatus Brocadiaceae bacterium]
MQKIPLSKSFVNDELKQAALRAIESGWYILAKECEAFEAELAKHTGAKHAVLSSSLTAGMYLLHLAMGLRSGDEVIVPSHTAFAGIEPMIHCGANPVFVDVDDTYCIDTEQLENAITPRTVGIMPVHLYGHPANLDRVFEIAKKRNLWVVEDCAQAQGAKYKGKTVGSMGVAGGFSFFPSKNLTVLGDGGCICTNDDKIADKIRMLRNHGRKEKYTHEMIGFNLRFNEVQAAIGRVALRHLDAFNQNRRKIAAYYNDRLKGIVKTPPEMSWATAVYHMYVIRVDRRDELAKYLKQNGVETGIHYPVPNHKQPAITKKFNNLPKLPKTEEFVDDILSLPIHGEMSLDEAKVVCDFIAKFYSA